MLVNKKRWNPEDKIRIVMESLNTNITIAELCRKYQITPVEFIHVHKPEQNGHIESFHKTLKKEYIWTHDFASYKQADETIRRHIMTTIILGFIQPLGTGHQRNLSNHWR